MAEKELRIAIYKTDKQVVEGNYGDFYNTMTRQEAITKMAKAICKVDDDGGCALDCGSKCESWKYSIPHAEAALNALLKCK